MTKSELRKLYLNKRAELSAATLAQFNFNIYNLFFSSFDLSFIRVIHIFLPIAHNNEPDTWMIIDRMRREFPGVQLSVPKVNPVTGDIDSFNFEGLHQLRENKWGIPEPKRGTPTIAEKIDMVLLPLLAFDQYGNRLGYGKGYYDRFLVQCREDIPKIGISLFPPCPELPVEDHDIKLTHAITPERLFQF